MNHSPQATRRNLAFSAISAAVGLALAGCNTFAPAGAGAAVDAAAQSPSPPTRAANTPTASAAAGAPSPLAADRGSPQQLAAQVPMQYQVAQLQDGSRSTFALCAPPGCEAPTVKTLAVRAPVTPVAAAGAAAGATLTATAQPVPVSPLPTMQMATEPQPAAPPPAGPAEERAPLVQRAVITFDLAKPTLTADAAARLEALRPLLRRAHRVKVTGYTDDLGEQAYNDALAHARARTALIRLRELIGEKEAQLSASGRGLCCYVVANSSHANRATNRRAELEITLPGDEQTRRLIAALAQQLGAPSWQAAASAAAPSRGASPGLAQARHPSAALTAPAASPRPGSAALVRYTPQDAAPVSARSPAQGARP